jgi:prepilin-type N-terminal cleavage/methylation domain-containing protein
MFVVTRRLRSVGRLDRGFTIFEALAALAIFGMALVVATHALSAQAAAAKRAEVRQQLLSTAETALESLRGGVLPLQTGRLDLGRDFRQGSANSVHLFVDVMPRDLPGLFEVEVRVWTQLPGREETLAIKSMVWRP